MENVKMDVRTIMCLMGDRPEEFAQKTGIKLNHLKQLLNGRSRLLARDLLAICDYSKVPVYNVKVD